jgi:hypothetical protein
MNYLVPIYKKVTTVMNYLVPIYKKVTTVMNYLVPIYKKVTTVVMLIHKWANPTKLYKYHINFNQSFY